MSALVARCPCGSLDPQSLIRDRRCPQLYLLAASQTRDKTALTEEGVQRVIAELQQQFDYIICDSPAGIESGALHAMYFADRAIICTAVGQRILFRQCAIRYKKSGSKVRAPLRRCAANGGLTRPSSAASTRSFRGWS